MASVILYLPILRTLMGWLTGQAARYKDLKRGLRTDRQRDMRRPGPGARKPRLSVEQLKLVTRCGKCCEKGHWHKDEICRQAEPLTGSSLSKSQRARFLKRVVRAFSCCFWIAGV